MGGGGGGPALGGGFGPHWALCSAKSREECLQSLKIERVIFHMGWQLLASKQLLRGQPACQGSQSICLPRFLTTLRQFFLCPLQCS